LGLENIKTPQSDFDRDLLADIFMGNTELKPENVGVIGSGGIYSTMEDLCRYAVIFMDGADGLMLSKKSVNEMAKVQHQMEIVSPDTDTIFRYGLGWDSVETYPFAKYGIKALSKSGDTVKYHTNLIVLPEYNLAAAVSASGNDSKGQLIAQEIILEALREAGLINDGAAAALPEQNLEPARVPADIKAYAGIYDAGLFGQMNVEFTDDALILTSLMVRNERPQKYLYGAKGEFVSTNGDYIGADPGKEDARGVTAISFSPGGYLMIQTYEYMPGLGGTAIAMPVAKKLEGNPVLNTAMEAWKKRNNKEYLLVSEKYTSIKYIGQPMAKTLTDDRLYGYVGHGIYKGGGELFNLAKIAGETTALGFQNIPTMAGRDINNLYVTEQDGIEYLGINDFRYIDAASAKKISEIDKTFAMGGETVWVDIDGKAGGQILNIATPQNGSWFVYDGKMNCIATSLEKHPRNMIVLPDNGRIMFAGEEGAVFSIK